MYKDYFGLREEPFSIAPDPQFLYMSERHREALAHLLYGLKTDGGFVLLTGEVGTGKTTVCRCLLEQIPENSEIAFVLNPKLTVIELLETICDELGISYPQDNQSIKVFIDAINRFLLEAHSQGRKTVLIIDEAQNLSPTVLEQIRLLTNLETNKQKLLQVLMIGQPELKEMLERADLRQLAQRITARYHLEPLSRNEIKAYISHRLNVAGVERPLFPAATLRKLYSLSGGVPRLINLLCDRALLGAYVREQQSVSPKLLHKAAIEVFGNRSKSHQPGVLLWQWLLTLLVVAIGSVVLVSTYWPEREIPAPATTEVATAKSPPLDTLEWDEQHLITQSRAMAFRDLFSLWQANFNGEQGSIDDQAGRQGLSLLNKRGSLGMLRQLDRPAVLKLKNLQGQEFYATLISLTEATASLIIGSQRRTIPIAALSEQWYGEFSLLWQTPVDFRGALKPGDKGKMVTWLEEQMAILNGRAARAENEVLFDQQLQREVQEFQAEVGLVPDGVVGAFTLIQLNSRISQQQPTLSARKKG